MPQSRCKNVKGRIVCGMLHSGGKTTKDGVYRLAKGETVMTPQQVATLREMGKDVAKKVGKKVGKKVISHAMKKKQTNAMKNKKKKCTCKH